VSSVLCSIEFFSTEPPLKHYTLFLQAFGTTDINKGTPFSPRFFPPPTPVPRFFSDFDWISPRLQVFFVFRDWPLPSFVLDPFILECQGPLYFLSPNLCFYSRRLTATPSCGKASPVQPLLIQQIRPFFPSRKGHCKRFTESLTTPLWRPVPL